MAITITRKTSWLDKDAANMRCGYIDVAFDDTYVDDGMAWDTDDFAPGITLYEMTPCGGGDALYEYFCDLTNEKIVVIVRIGGEQVAADVDLEGITAQRFFYRGV